MCLVIKHRDPNKLPFKNGRLTAYKVLRVNQFSELVPVYQYRFIYNPGFNKAIGKVEIEFDYDFVKDITREIINDGAIHVCLSKNSTKSHADIRCVVVPVTCYKKDFIAFGKYGEACFSQVYLTKENYKKALKAKSRYELLK